jgi:hypothetical protein
VHRSCSELSAMSLRCSWVNSVGICHRYFKDYSATSNPSDCGVLLNGINRLNSTTDPGHL